ncbi:MAG: glycosyltransferase, partial [Flavobacterium sp.]
MNNSKITVITVVYNCHDTIEATILSVINQTYDNVEYIIIDGGSKDGTVDVIKKYQDQINYWVSEPDEGIYEAMNKGIDKASGDWINFMNSGDSFTSDKVLSSIFASDNYIDVDILYGNCIMVENNSKIEHISGTDINRISKNPIYRHGASFVSTDVHKEFMFDVSLKDKLGFALDYNCIYQLYLAKKKFQKVDVNVLTYQKEGISNQPLKGIWYKYLITRKKSSKYSFEYCKTLLKISVVYLLSLRKKK